MASIDTVRERCKALAQQMIVRGRHTHTDERRLRWWCLTWRLGAVLALGFTLASPYTVQAKTFHCGAGDVQCLIDAIEEANANGQQNTIRLKAGTYALTTVDNDTDGPNGLPSITGRIILRGTGAATTRLERVFTGPFPCLGDEPAFRILHVAPTGVLTLKGLTLRGGCLPSNGPNGGGGIRNTGTLTVTDSTIADNGGVQINGGGIASNGPLTVINSKIVDNGVIDGGAGGIASSGPLTVFHSLIALNNSDGAGGIGAGGLTVIAHSSIVDNGRFGGIGNGGTMHITDSTIARNHDGGINNGDGTLIIANSTITENDTDDHQASGIDNEGGTVIILNSTIAQNKAISTIFSVGTGAGLRNAPSFANPLDGTVILQNTILAQNIVEEPSAISNDCDGPITSLGHNLIGAPTDCMITLQSSDLTGDPGLNDFTDTGRPGNGHFPLLPTSQAIDAGNDAVCPRRDQLGQRRVNIPREGTSRCDIGAIEFPGKDHRPHKENDDHHDKDHRPHEENDDHHDKDLAAAAQATP